MRPIKRGSTDQSVIVRFLDIGDGSPENAVSSATAGIDMWYRRETLSLVSITETSLATAAAAHTDGGIIVLDDGYYRLDVPDAAFAASAGVNGVLIGGFATSMVVIGCYCPLVSYDPYGTVFLATGGFMASNWAAGAIDSAAIAASAFTTSAFAGGALTNTKFAAAAVNSTVLGVSLGDILADTNELQVDWVNGGRLDLLIDALGVGSASLIAHAGTQNIALASLIAHAGTQNVALASLLTHDTTQEVALASLIAHALTQNTDLDNLLIYEASILGDTNMLQVDWVDGGRLDLILDNAGAAGDPWDTSIPGAYAAGTAGYIVGGFLDASISSIAAGSGPTAASIVAALFNESLPEAFAAGTAGYIIGTNLDATVTSRASASAYTSARGGYLDKINQYIDASLDSIKDNVDNIYDDWQNGGRLDLLLDALGVGSASLIAHAGTQNIALASLIAHDGTQNIALASLIAHDGTQNVALASLIAHAGTQNVALTSLLTHDTTQEVALASLIAHDGTQNIAIASLLAHAVIIEGDTTQIQIDIAALENITAAEVNAEIVDALATDTYAEPGAGAPAATTTLAVKIGNLYQAWRNRKTATASLATIYLDDATTSAHTAAIGDDGSVFDHGEWGA